MNKRIILTVLLAFACTAVLAQNPLLQKRYGTPHEIPPFGKITIDNYREAMIKGMEADMQEVQAIIDNPAEPTFENVIVALDRSGKQLSKAYIWSTLNGSNSTPEFQALSREMSPLTSAHSSAIRMNKALFAKIKAVYDKRDKLGLNTE